jgi:3-phosphoshikimate 1-carboxyvinyltransferase
MAIRGGGLSGIHYSPPVPSAQVKSAILIAGLLADGETVVEENLPTRDHTERLLQAMSAPIRIEEGRVTLQGHFRLRPVDVKIPGDISSAVFFAAAAICLPDSEVCLPAIGVNPTRTGAFDVLGSMGAPVEFINRQSYLEEPVADIIAKTCNLSGVTVSPELIPTLIDELPVIAVVATQAVGETVIRGAAELRHKESDRIAATVDNLSRLGADIEELRDGFVVRGPCRLTGTLVHSHGDHRIAMAAAIAALLADGTTIIEGSEAIDVSYPGFFDDMKGLLGSTAGLRTTTLF